jgi:ABC-2 type transport system permease protein
VFSGLANSIARETGFVRHSPWDAALVSVIPLLLTAFVLVLFARGVPRGLPVAVVDDDHSALSRKLITALQGVPTARVIAQPATLAEAGALVRTGEIFGFLYVPRGADVDARRGRRATLFAFFNAQFYTAGNLVARDLEAAAGSLNIALNPMPPGHNRAVDSRAAREAPVGAQAALLFNPTGSYDWTLGAALVTALLHIAFSCTMVLAIGREIAPGARREWKAAAGGGLLAALVYKIIFYAIIYTFHGTLYLIIMRGVFGFPVHGSLPLLIGAQFLFYFACGCLMSVIIGASRGDLGFSIAICVMLTSAAFTYGDAVFPFADASLFAKSLSAMLPYTHYMRVQVMQFQMDSAVRDALPWLGVLALFGAILLPLGTWMLHEVMKLTPETAGAPGGKTSKPAGA